MDILNRSIEISPHSRVFVLTCADTPARRSKARIREHSSPNLKLEHDRAVVSALLEQGISKEVIANAVSSTDTSAAGVEFRSKRFQAKNQNNV